MVLLSCFLGPLPKFSKLAATFKTLAEKTLFYVMETIVMVYFTVIEVL